MTPDRQWKAAVEYCALYCQGFDVAQMHAQAAPEERQPGDNPLAIGADVHSTVLQPLSYRGFLINKNMGFFDAANSCAPRG